MDLGLLMKLKSMGERFKSNHPKFLPFLKDAGTNIDEGSTIEIIVTTSSGRKIESNIRVKSDDVDMLKELGRGLK